MTKITLSNRAGKDGSLGVGCSASIFDEAHEKILLVRRSDNEKWAVPGGYMDPGESFSEACEREVKEETGLDVQATHLLGVYTSPHLLVEYADGNKYQLVVLHFEAEQIGGNLEVSDETTELAFFSKSEIPILDMNELDRKRALASFTQNKETAICNDFLL